MPAPGTYESALLTKGQPVADDTMTKAALAEEVVDFADLTKKHAKLIVDTVLGSIVEALYRGEKIEVRGLGSFRHGSVDRADVDGGQRRVGPAKRAINPKAHLS